MFGHWPLWLPFPFSKTSPPVSLEFSNLEQEIETFWVKIDLVLDWMFLNSKIQEIPAAMFLKTETEVIMVTTKSPIITKILQAIMDLVIIGGGDHYDFRFQKYRHQNLLNFRTWNFHFFSLSIISTSIQLIS